ncbi:hypothetical protein ACFCXS_26920 [Streptomyces sp. NPDC056373]|uniref:hypothetical protein n=1 Tax=Streptomyces sp. NPDC056373 TaxID=3345798 RepID=UPI0035E20857
MANEPQGNAPLESVRETLEKTVSDVQRVLGLQGLRAGDSGGGAVPQAGVSTLSVGCSTASVICGTQTMQR